MKAMIFAAGVGSRLKELTRDTPKCLMQVGGRAILEHVVERLKSAGVTAVGINVHHHAEQVVRFVRERNNFGIEVRFSQEDRLLDTGGGLKKLASFFEKEQAFLIHNSDIYSSVNLSELVRLHSERNAIGTLAIMKRPSKRGVYVDQAHHLTGWTGESPTHAPGPSETLFAFSGISVASGELFQYMGEEEIFSLIAAYLRAARATDRVWGHPIQDGAWIDIGTPEQLRALNETLDRA
jgi:NDP-sugar pyrophosphorylase family protein